jgi:hypothetical protein
MPVEAPVTTMAMDDGRSDIGESTTAEYEQNMRENVTKN